MRFVKMHGTGNDFVLIEAKGDERDWPRLAVAMCDRHFGVGADGLLLVLPSDKAALRMRIFNPDGSEAEMCGNGIRCLAKYAVERGLVRPTDGRFDVETRRRRAHAPGLRRGRAASRGCASAWAGRASPPRRYRCSSNAEPPLVNMPLEIVDGASRQVLPVTCRLDGQPPRRPLRPAARRRLPAGAASGPMVAHHPLFPNGVNFEVARVLDRDRIEARVWERGAGPTLACGTGASAVDGGGAPAGPGRRRS